MAAYEYLPINRYPRPDTAFPHGSALSQLIDDARAPPFPVAKAVAAPRRDRLWELSNNLHCSIIGTCLTTTDLRALLAKLGERDARTMSEHALHHHAVALAERKEVGSKLLHKLLDRRHARAITQLDRVHDVASLHAFWREAVNRGEIPGAYWAVLTHPITDQNLVREVYGEVHMLSHLVGRAVRADLRRLAELEETLAERDDTITEQQERIRALTEDKAVLSQGLAAAHVRRGPSAPQLTATRTQRRDEAEVGHLREQLGRIEAHVAALAERRASLEGVVATLSEDLRSATAREAAVTRERDALERALDDDLGANDAFPEPAGALTGCTLLYVGGRPRQVAQARRLIERRGGVLLSHDGGIEDAPGLLPGLVARADRVLFPVDCVSHEAALTVKRCCREGGPPLLPLRSASLAALVAALGNADEVRPIAGGSP